MISILRKKLEHKYMADLGFASGKEFTKEIIDSAVRGGVFLDAGCGEGKVNKLLPEGVRYIGIDCYEGKDREGYAGWQHKPTIVADLHDIPLRSSSCDTVILLHVLEHVHSPSRVLCELARVMKDGAHIFIAVPFLHPIHHAPNDHYRFTKYSLENLIITAGLTVLSIKPSGGYFRALAKALRQFVPIYTEQTLMMKIVLFPLFFLIETLFWIITLLEYPLDLLDRKQTLTCGYLCSTVKKEPEEVAERPLT